MTRNRLPHVRYVIVVGLEFRSAPPIDYPGTIPPLRRAPPGPLAGPSPCLLAEEVAKEEALAWKGEFDKLNDEAALPALLQRGDELIAGLAKVDQECGGMSPVPKAITTTFHNAQAATTVQLMPLPEVAAGQRLTVRITRDNPAREWTHILDTPSTGNWMTSFGMNFAFNFGREYFSLPNTGAGQANTFTITEKHRTFADYIQYVPSVFFTHIGPEAPTTNLWGWTFGFGSSQQSPAAFVGASYVVRQNAQLVFGAMFTSTRGLKGEYDIKQRNQIRENLSSDALGKTGIAPTAFFGIAVNFGRDPFGTDTPKPEAGTP